MDKISEINFRLAEAEKELSELETKKEQLLQYMDRLWEKRYHLLNNEIDEPAPSDFLIIDECHIVPARSFEIVARQCKARYITGRSILIRKQVNPNQQPFSLFVNMSVFASTNFSKARILAPATHSKKTTPIFHIFPALLTQERLYHSLRSRIG